jgi:hypothetical protein
MILLLIYKGRTTLGVDAEDEGLGGQLRRSLGSLGDIGLPTFGKGRSHLSRVDNKFVPTTLLVDFDIHLRPLDKGLCGPLLEMEFVTVFEELCEAFGDARQRHAKFSRLLIRLAIELAKFISNFIYSHRRPP